MLVAFGSRRCPFCGSFGKELHSYAYHCARCKIVFNDFSVSEVKEFEDKMWN